LRTTIARESDSVLRVSENANQPPTDIAMLQARLATVLAERDAAIAERDQALAQNHRLQHLLHQLQRMQFGRRSEKLDADQLALAFEDVEQAVAATEAADDKKDPGPPRYAPTSAGPIAVRFPPICRACM
jgi:hypothetical protein